MALDTVAKRRAVLGIGRPWYRSSYTTGGSGTSVAQRASIGNVYGDNGIASGSAVGEWEMIPPWKKHRRIATRINRT